MNALQPRPTTIAAIATPPGRGGVGVVRVSGAGVPDLARALLGRLPKPRSATFCAFRDADGQPIDLGLALYFPAPRSYTAEHLLELHAHGNPVILDRLLRRLFELGATPARPGEFTERAFLNGKLDLAQAEAVADLIGASTEQAARSAQRSLQGEFSRHVRTLVESLIDLRSYVEAALDFSDEDIDFLSEGQVGARLVELAGHLAAVRASARQGQLLRDGMTVVIAGRPNAGKSSLLNRLAGAETAIVTDIPGTTRDLLRESIQIDGLPLHIIDTAGLRDSDDPVEREGLRRARAAMHSADRILLVIDATAPADPILPEELPPGIGITRIHNKIDLLGQPPSLEEQGELASVHLSARTGAGLELLRLHLKNLMGYREGSEDVFIARRRHLDALERAARALEDARIQLETSGAAELVAEELRLAQQALNEITGEFTSEDLLGRIFGSFCIGK